ncbi:Fic family protein [Oceanobacillus neutriphilus]|uniref:Cell filamentation protein Fic n=1 Tax=Oceanobacillus neutriphilus TaxID=531815 RepID=A0ABQ2P1G8_9BACI|nr:Fic family protein [Oceanobacillus neutriphilus]GGP15569.1 cell filamentation protein Fic [Oceanobacillus neutriphilus]
MQPPFDITDHMLNRIVEISELVGELKSEYERNLHMRKDNRIRSIQSSLAIENNTLTIQQVTDIIDGKRILGSPKEIKEVKNAYGAYEAILSFDPYSVEDFLKAHGYLTNELVEFSGRFRQKDVGIFDAKGNVVHVGARPQFIVSLVEELFSWSKTASTPALIKSCVIHYEIEAIHPFEDGNGRIGRFWQNVILSGWQPIFAWIPFETIIYEHQQQYYDVLALADKDNNSTKFIEFMLDVILETLQKYPKKDDVQ